MWKWKMEDDTKSPRLLNLALRAGVAFSRIASTHSEMYLIAGDFTGHRSSQTIGRPLHQNIPSTWRVLLPGTAQTSWGRLRPVPREFDALFATARTWDTLTSVSLRLP